MRRQNPPQANIEKAKHIERYMRRPVIGMVYASLGIVYAVFAWAIFFSLVRDSLLAETPITVAVFAAIVLVPAGGAFLGVFVSPNDPISHRLAEVADKWRRPLDTPAELFTFRELMMSGETSCIKISFFLPLNNRTGSIKERIYNYVHGVLGKECGLRTAPPPRLEVQNLIEAPMEILASECDIPILYWEVDEVYEMQPGFNTPNTLSPQYSGMGA
ncbi:MAG TPA: hypothetical protein VGT04_08765 [Acidobacteriaceae bacterium]|nr:hypothetical protein [Acidobacteriaceae bacterium]